MKSTFEYALFLMGVLYPSNLEMLGSAKMTWFVDARRFKDLVILNQESATKYTSQGPYICKECPLGA
ncbi:hypothetical protein F9277_07590 [Vibrio harveyi]|nr:hypothetical protein F9277_07590 [Vibrio harveyi]